MSGAKSGMQLDGVNPVRSGMLAGARAATTSPFQVIAARERPRGANASAFAQPAPTAPTCLPLADLPDPDVAVRVGERDEGAVMVERRARRERARRARTGDREASETREGCDLAAALHPPDTGAAVAADRDHESAVRAEPHAVAGAEVGHACAIVDTP